jgi:hypothetical protein
LKIKGYNKGFHSNEHSNKEKRRRKKERRGKRKATTNSQRLVLSLKYASRQTIRTPNGKKEEPYLENNEEERESN